MRGSVWGVAGGIVVAAALVGSMLLVPTGEPGAEPESEPREVAVQGALLQAPGDERPQLCGALMESHPPQCAGGHVVLGDVDWAAIEAEEASGTRWAEGVWVVGEPSAGTFMLSRPVSLEQPEGVVVASIDQLG